LYENGRIADLLSLRQRLLEVILFAAIPIWISLAIFAAPLCNLLGSQYLPSVPVLRIVALRSVTSVLDGFLGHGFLVAVNRVKERQQALSRCLLILASLSLVFGYFWGAIGVGFALVISDLILILQYLWIAAGIGLKIPWPSLSGNLAAAVLMTLCALGLPSDINFMLRASAAAAVYFVVLLLVCRNRIVKVGHTLRECVER